MAKRFKSDGVAEKIVARSTQFTRDGQVQKPLLAQSVIVFHRVRSVAIMFGSAGREIGREFGTSVAQMLLSRRKIEIHGSYSLKPASSATASSCSSWHETGLSSKGLAPAATN